MLISQGTKFLFLGPRELKVSCLETT